MNSSDNFLNGIVTNNITSVNTMISNITCANINIKNSVLSTNGYIVNLSSSNAMITNIIGNNMVLYNDAVYKPNGGSWTGLSDERLKTNITIANLQLCYDTIKNIPLKKYTWRDDIYSSQQVFDRSRLGWIAQDVEMFIPKSVEKIEQYGYLDCRSFNNDQIIAHLYGCVKQLIKNVEALQDEINSMNQNFINKN